MRTRKGGETNVPISSINNKQSINFPSLWTHRFLPMQLIYKGKTNKSLLKVTFPGEFLLSANEKNYSNEKKSLKFLGEFLLSYIQQERKNLGPENQKALIISFMTYFVSKLLTKSLNFWMTNNILVIKLGVTSTLG